jgi:hypothetical protein
MAGGRHARTRVGAVLGLLAAVIAVTALVSPAIASASEFYGYASASDPNFNDNEYNNCWFQYLTVSGVQNYQPNCPASGTNAGSTGGAVFDHFRVGTPWDTVDMATSASGNPSCTPSGLWSNGQGSYWTSLISTIKNAEHDGLSPVIVLGNSPLGSADNANSNGTPSDNDYYCGLYGLMTQLTATNQCGSNGTSSCHVGAFELYNEPDCAPDATQCDRQPSLGQSEFDSDPLNKYGHTCSDCGKYAAGDLYVDAWWSRYEASLVNSSDAGDYLVAGGLSQWSLDDTTNNGDSSHDGFMNQYIGEVQDWASGNNFQHYAYGWPQRWSGHDYTDVSSGGLTGTSEAWNLVNTVHNWDPGSWIWLTESADWLDNNEYPYSDGNSTAQADAAEEFMGIDANSGSGGGSPQGTPVAYVEGVFWYDFYPGNTPTNWDSGLVDSNFGLRQSYCVLAGFYGQSWCGQGSPNDTLDPNG